MLLSLLNYRFQVTLVFSKEGPSVQNLTFLKKFVIDLLAKTRVFGKKKNKVFLILSIFDLRFENARQFRNNYRSQVLLLGA